MTSVTEVSNEQSIIVYPNPATQNATLIISGKNNYISKIEIFDITGKQLKLINNIGEVNDKIEIALNIQDLPAGIYSVHTWFTNRVETTQLIVK